MPRAAREVWLNTGDHDIMYSENRDGVHRVDRRGPPEHDPYGLFANTTVGPPFISSEFASVLNGAMDFVERLAPSRAWLSRNFGAPMTTAVYERAFHRIEGWARHEVRSTARRDTWRYVDHLDVWSCHARGAQSVPLHTGAIMRGYLNRSYTDLYLSTLRTLAAVWTIGGAPHPCHH